MGCQSSKYADFHADKVDDSIHAMLEREKRSAQKNGEQPHTYRPRDPHPLLLIRKVLTCEEEDTKTTEGSVSSALHGDDHIVGAAQLLAHTKLHLDTVNCQTQASKLSSSPLQPRIPVSGSC
jgi:hypothetical protein